MTAALLGLGDWPAPFYLHEDRFETWLVDRRGRRAPARYRVDLLARKSTGGRQASRQ